MPFSTLPFFIFFTFHLLIFACLPKSKNLWLILVSSTVFYAYANPIYLLVPHTLTFVAFIGMRVIRSCHCEKQRKQRLALTICLLLTPLIIFKYSALFFSWIQAAGWASSLTLPKLDAPLGISFITFSLIAHTIDIVDNGYPILPRFGELLGANLFYPHLIAGPIVRPKQILGQMQTPKVFQANRWPYSLTLFSIGFIKKKLIADSLAPVVQDAFQTLPHLSFTHAWVAMYAFLVQIYCDFSGYTDMGISLAWFLGFRLPANFDRPYLSTSISEFWRRWHITLSDWFRDYVYIPLGGNRTGGLRQFIHLLITMGLGGLWHGANLTFLVWGLLHGVGISISHFLKGRIPAPRLLAQCITVHFFGLSLIIFRAKDLRSAVNFFHSMFTPEQPDLGYLKSNAFPMALILLFASTHFLDSRIRIRWVARYFPKWTLILLSLLGGLLSVAVNAGKSVDFIYFDF